MGVDGGQTLLRTVQLLPVSDGLVVLQLRILSYERQPELHVDLWGEDSVKGAFKSLQKLLCIQSESVKNLVNTKMSV